MKNFRLLILTTIFFSFIFIKVQTVFAGSADGIGPWADSVISNSQGTMKNGLAVPANRSNPQAAVGIAENSLLDTDFFSLGFGGNIVLRFDNGVREGIVVVETTFSGYPVEKAEVAVSSDGISWVTAGVVNQDGQVSMPENYSCVNYVKITDVSNIADFSDDTADAFDVDGVQAVNAEACGVQSPTPTQDPESTPTSTLTPTPTQSSSNNSNNNENNSSSSQPKECSANKPGTPSMTSVQKTSNSTVKLSWTAVSGASSYAISYGTAKGSYQYGVPSTGNVTEFTIGGLNSNTQYYFVVRALNDCMPGDASGETAVAGQVLGAATGDVLGATTDQLAATGGTQTAIHTVMAILAGIGSFFGIKKVTKNSKN